MPQKTSLRVISSTLQIPSNTTLPLSYPLSAFLFLLTGIFPKFTTISKYKLVMLIGANAEIKDV